MGTNPEAYFRTVSYSSLERVDPSENLDGAAHSKPEKGGPRSAPWPTAGPVQICPSPPSTLISTPVM
jgi:hypothetical protein